MISSEDEIKPFTQTPVINFYGPRLKPEDKYLDEIDAVFVDLQEVGCRVYLYMEFISFNEGLRKKEVVILDRPNLIGSQIEGPLLKSSYRSFVGMDILPMKYSLTMGELANLFKNRNFRHLNLGIIKMKRYKREFLFPETKTSLDFSIS